MHKMSLFLFFGALACAPTKADQSDDGSVDDENTDGEDGTDSADGGDGDDGGDGGDDGGDGDDGADGGDDGDDGGDDGGDVDPASLEGRAYMLDLAGADWVSPPGVSLLIGSLEQTLLVGVDSASEDEINFIGTVTTSIDDPEQDPCVTTQDLVGDFSAPEFAIDEGTLSVVISDVEVPLHDFAFSGTFEADGSAIVDGNITASIDVRDIAPLIDFGTPDDICGTLAALGATCQTCSSDGESYCLDTDIQDIQADEVDIEIERITEIGDDCR